jgi:hypothetical protein
MAFRRRRSSRTRVSVECSLPENAQACIRELELLEEKRQVIINRVKIVTAKLKLLVGKQRTPSWSQKSTQPRNKEATENKTNSLSNGEKVNDDVTSSQHEIVNNDNPVTSRTNRCWSVVKEAVIGSEMSSPLITAIKNLRERREQQRAITIWTKNLTHLFLVADADDSGYIDKSEYQQMIEMLGMSDELKFCLREKFSSIDKNGSGGINLDEFLIFFLTFPMFEKELMSNADNNTPHIYLKSLSRTQHWQQ